MPCPKSIASLEMAVIKARNDQTQDRLEDAYKNSSQPAIKLAVNTVRLLNQMKMMENG